MARLISSVSVVFESVIISTRAGRFWRAGCVVGPEPDRWRHGSSPPKRKKIIPVESFPGRFNRGEGSETVSYGHWIGIEYKMYFSFFFLYLNI